MALRAAAARIARLRAGATAAVPAWNTVGHPHGRHRPLAVHHTALISRTCTHTRTFTHRTRPSPIVEVYGLNIFYLSSVNKTYVPTNQF